MNHRKPIELPAGELIQVSELLSLIAKHVAPDPDTYVRTVAVGGRIALKERNIQYRQRVHASEPVAMAYGLVRHRRTLRMIRLENYRQATQRAVANQNATATQHYQAMLSGGAMNWQTLDGCHVPTEFSADAFILIETAQSYLKSVGIPSTTRELVHVFGIGEAKNDAPSVHGLRPVRQVAQEGAELLAEKAEELPDPAELREAIKSSMREVEVYLHLRTMALKWEPTTAPQFRTADGEPAAPPESYESAQGLFLTADDAERGLRFLVADWQMMESATRLRIEREREGRHTLRKAAAMLAEHAGCDEAAMRRKLIAAAQAGALPVHEPGRPERYDHSRTVRHFHHEAYWSDLNDWLQDHEPRIAWRFPDPAASATAEPESVTPAGMAGLQRQQEQAILSHIRTLGHNPLALPPNAAGKPGVKAAVRDRCPWPGKRFDKAWERLRSRQEIQDGS